ncbi:hypothetical protein ACFV0D_22230 [Streptomyces sp. NPDC059556]
MSRRRDGEEGAPIPEELAAQAARAGDADARAALDLLDGEAGSG